jgi:hypothetical protein
MLRSDASVENPSGIFPALGKRRALENIAEISHIKNQKSRDARFAIRSCGMFCSSRSAGIRTPWYFAIAIFPF